MPGPYFGKYKAFIRNIDDPLKIGRAKLEVPGILGSVLTDWADPILVDAGSKNVGVFPRLRVGDRVWAEFQAGNENRPIFGGGWWGQGDALSLAVGAGANDASRAGKGTDVTTLPPTILPNSSVQEPTPDYSTGYAPGYVLRTPSGFVIEIDETPGKERFQLFHPSGTSFEVLANGRLIVKTAGGRYSRTNGDDVKHTLGTEVYEVERDRIGYVQGSDAQEVSGKKQVFAKQGIVLEDELGNVIIFDPQGAKLTIQSAGNLDVIAAGTISLDATNINILGRAVNPTPGVPI